jgi:rubrerythrin
MIQMTEKCLINAFVGESMAHKGSLYLAVLPAMA